MVVCAIFSEALGTLLQTIPRDLAQVNSFMLVSPEPTKSVPQELAQKTGKGFDLRRQPPFSCTGASQRTRPARWTWPALALAPNSSSRRAHSSCPLRHACGKKSPALGGGLGRGGARWRGGAVGVDHKQNPEMGFADLPPPSPI